MTRPDGRHIGVFFGDYFARPSKRSGAWMTGLRDQEKLDGEVRPLVLNVMNFNKGANGEPTLLSLRRRPHAVPRVRPRAARADVGRDLSDDLRHRRAAGLRRAALAALRALARPAGNPRALRAPLQDRRADAAGADGPADRVAHVQSGLTRRPNISARPMWISISISAARRTRTRSRRRRASGCRCREEVVLRHRPPHFQHIFSGDHYAAGYYSYLWSEVLDADAFNAFEETGDVFDPAVAQAAARSHLRGRRRARSGRGLRAFRGRMPTVDPLLQEARAHRTKPHEPPHRRTSPRRRRGAASCGGRGRAADARRGRQRARGDGRDGGGDRGRLPAHEPHRRRRLLADPRAVRARARHHGGGAGGREGDAGALPRARLRRRSRRAGRSPRSPCRARSPPGCSRCEAAEAYGGRLPLDVLLGPAIGHAREGYTVTRSQARLTAEKLAECRDAPGFAADISGRRQAAGRRRDAEAGGARRHARSTRQCGARRFLSRRCRARDRRRSGAHRLAGHARRSRTISRPRSPSRCRVALAGRHALQHAAADAGARLADHPGAVRAAARRGRRELRSRARADRGDQARVPGARPRTSPTRRA